MEKIIQDKIDELANMMIDGILEVVKIDSVKGTPSIDAPFGLGIKEALNKTLSIASSLGFTTKNIDNYIGYAQYGEGEDYIGIIGHLDVVEVGVGWTHPPFSGYVNDEGRIFSRGILDNKGPIMSCLYALYAIKELGIKLSKPVRIIFGTDEESGFEDLTYYLTKEKAPIMGWTPDCKYPVVYGERGRAVFMISADKKDITSFFDFVTTYFLESKSNGDRLEINYMDDEFGEMQIRNTKLKAKDSTMEFGFTLSYPAVCTLQEIEKQIETKLSEKLTLKLIHNYNPVKFDKDCFMVKQLQSAYESVMHCDGTPVTTTGGTYAKAMPNIVPFGPSFPGQKGIGHNPNEWMDIKDIINNAKIYALSIYKLAK
ncbi:MAG: Sapep family Mn(2+)-dependent dipeptidase [Longicatena sp.]